jgi:uncharacterized membrane protein YkvA (DUF1232 family)
MTTHSDFPSPLSPALNQAFAKLCEALPLPEAMQLKAAVRAHIEEVQRAVKPDGFLDLGLAVRMSAVLDELLAGYASHTEPQRALIVGAARYFVQTPDAEADTASVMGFDDDMEVLNHVLLAIGRPDLSAKLL